MPMPRCGFSQQYCLGGSYTKLVSLSIPAERCVVIDIAFYSANVTFGSNRLVGNVRDVGILDYNYDGI